MGLSSAPYQVVTLKSGSQSGGPVNRSKVIIAQDGNFFSHPAIAIKNAKCITRNNQQSSLN